jgi:hypothetical protein
MASYRIEPIDGQFRVMDRDSNVVDILPTKEAAEAEVERCSKEDIAWDSAKLLFDIAIRAHMEMHGTDREVSRRMLRDAAEVVD